MTDWEAFRRDYLENKEKMKATRLSEFSDLVSMIDNLKVEIHGRFRHLLNSLAALEVRLCKLESLLGVRYKPWVPLMIDEELEVKGAWGSDPDLSDTMKEGIE